MHYIVVDIDLLRKLQTGHTNVLTQFSVEVNGRGGVF